MHLGGLARGPGGQRELERLTVRNALGVVAVVVEDVPDDAEPTAFRHPKDVAQREDAVVVLDHEPSARAVRQALERAQEALGARLSTPFAAAHVQHDDGLGAEAKAVEETGLELEVAARSVTDLGSRRVQHYVLRGMAREADP